MKRSQFHIKCEEVSIDRNAIEEIFIVTAKKFGLFDNTVTSRSPGTIKSIVEKEGYGFGLGARAVGKLIVVDFFPNKAPTSPVFEDICNYVGVQMSLAFPGQVFEVNEQAFIPTH